MQVYLAKRYQKRKKRNGQREWVWALRWQDASGKWKYESTNTADRVKAESLRAAKLEELAKPDAPEHRPPDTWEECETALERAMRADNLRPSYVSNALLFFRRFRRMFPHVATPADVTTKHANEFKRQRAKLSTWTVKSDIATMRAIFGKWLGRELELLTSNPFEKVRAPKTDEPDIRIVTSDESAALFDWLSDRWKNWRLPLVYLQVAALVGWRANEIASLTSEDLLPDGFIRVVSASCKTRRNKFGWLPAELYREVKACGAHGWAFGRFSDELRRRLIICRRSSHHAARVKEFTPARLVGWLQDELKRFHGERAATAAKAELPEPESFTLHDFRRTAITGLQMSGVSEKECSLLVGATPEVIRKHYEKLDGMRIAKRSIERRANDPDARSLRAFLRADEIDGLDDATDGPQTQVG